MRTRILTIAALICALSAASCRSDVKQSAPYISDTGLTFEVDDGTGIFYSEAKSYLPIYCATKYPIRKMDIGQDNFEAIEGLVTAGDIWGTQVVAVPQCQIIDVELPGQYYKFATRDKSITLHVGQCQRIDSAHEPYLKTMRQIVRHCERSSKTVCTGRVHSLLKANNSFKPKPLRGSA